MHKLVARCAFPALLSPNQSPLRSGSTSLGALACLLALGCGSASTGEKPGPGGKGDDASDTLPAVVPKRIIWLIGDGMGVAQITAAAYANGDPLAMLSMPKVAFIATHEHEFATTDSAAAASAMASGNKTHFEAVGVFPGTTEDDEEDSDNHFETIIDVAKESGWRTGLVATTSLVDATPAAFAAHRSHRSSKNEIAIDLTNANVDVMLGGSLRFFEGRSDGLNLLATLRDKGYSVTKTKLGLSRVAGRATQAIGLFADKDMPAVVSGNRIVGLPTMTEKAIKMLDNENDDGFFLMVEGSWIDRESHVVNGIGTIAETLEFDQAVAAALKYARGRDDTLVIVTADHETGGLAILDPATAGARVTAIGGTAMVEELTSFSNANSAPALQEHTRNAGALTPSAGGDALVTSYGFLSVASRPSFSGPSFLFRATHSATNVVLLADGPGADYVTGVRDNTDLGKRVHDLARADGESDSDPKASSEETPENLILVVTDGLGLSALTATQYTRGDTTIADIVHRGLVSTHAADGLINSAAGSATTLSSGTLANRADIGLAGVNSILAKAEAAGRRTAIVTTASIAAPAVAAFYAHGAPNSADAVIDFEAGDGIDLVIAGGRDAFTAADLERWEARGAKVETTWKNSTPSATEQTIRLIADAALPRAGVGDAPSLATMTKRAIASLEKSDQPYVLVIYAGGVGQATNNLERGPELIDEVVALDEAVNEALAAAVESEETTVVVTSLGDSSLSVIDNHYGFHKKHCGIAKRCGGDLVMTDIPLATDKIHRGEGFDDSGLQGDFAPTGVILQYAWINQQAGETQPDSGSANFVPVFAFGPGSDAIRGFQLQTELAATLAILATGTPE